MDIEMYVKDVDTLTFADGEVIFEKGEAGEHMYLVKRGAVELTYGPGRGARVERGESFGEMSLLERAVRSATGVAVGETELYPISRGLFLVLVGETPYFALEVMKSLSNRLRAAGELTAQGN